MKRDVNRDVTGDVNRDVTGDVTREVGGAENGEGNPGASGATHPIVGSTEHRAESSYVGVKALVLGASGFIGRWVARSLSGAGAHVISAVRDADGMHAIARQYGISGDIVAVDLTDSNAIESLFASRRPSITFNLAGYGVDRSERDDALARRINTDLVGAVVRLSERYADHAWRGLRLVHTGSALEYGEIGGHLPEDAAPNPNTLYGQTKLAGTRLLVEARLPQAVAARLFTIYGPGEHTGRLLPTLLDARRSGEPVPLSAGTQRRDFTYVADVAEGLLALGLQSSVPGGVVNLATGKLYSVREFAETAARVLAIPAERLHFGAVAQRSDEMPHDTVSVDRLRQSIAWVPTTDVADGVRRAAHFLDQVTA